LFICLSICLFCILSGLRFVFSYSAYFIFCPSVYLLCLSIFKLPSRSAWHAALGNHGCVASTVLRWRVVGQLKNIFKFDFNLYSNHFSDLTLFKKVFKTINSVFLSLSVSFCLSLLSSALFYFNIWFYQLSLQYIVPLKNTPILFGNCKTVKCFFFVFWPDRFRFRSCSCEAIRLCDQGSNNGSDWRMQGSQLEPKQMSYREYFTSLRDALFWKFVDQWIICRYGLIK